MKATFTKKLHKALDSLKLPLEYLAIFALAASETDKDKKAKVKNVNNDSFTAAVHFL